MRKYGYSTFLRDTATVVMSTYLEVGNLKHLRAHDADMQLLLCAVEWYGANSSTLLCATEQFAPCYGLDGGWGTDDKIAAEKWFG